MSRRRRVVMVLLVVLVGLPLVVVVGGWIFLHSGYCERTIESDYGKALPGRLHVGRFELQGTGAIVLRDLTLGEEGQQPLLKVDEVRATVSLRKPHLRRIDVGGAHMRLDERSWDLMNRVIDAAKAIPGDGSPPSKLPVVVDGDLEAPGSLRVTKVHVDVVDEGQVDVADVTADYGGELVSLGIDSRPEKGVMRVLIDGRRVKGRVAPVIDALIGIGLLPPVPAKLRSYLPEVADASGTVVRQDPDAHSYSGPLQAKWEGGDGQATLAANDHEIKLTKLKLRDPAVAEAEGKLQADLDNANLQVELTRWRPGPRLELPAAIPVDGVLAIVPALKLQVWTRERECRVEAHLFAQGQSQAALDIEWRPDAPLKIDGAELPLALAQPFLPPQLAVNGGQAAQLHIGVGAQGLTDCFIEARQARCSARGWSFGPVDGRCDIRVAPEGALSVSAKLSKLGTVDFTPGGTGGLLHVQLDRVEDLLVRLHGPTDLPDLRGALRFDLRLKRDDHSFRGEMERLALEGVTMPDLLQDLAAVIRGSFEWRDDHLEARFGGQLKRGQLRLPGAWLDLATRSPLFTANFAFTPAIGYAPAALDVNEILVRAADAQTGEPLPSGYSAQLAGNLTATGTGEIRGVVDHADLAWINGMLALGALSMAGEGAIAISADLYLAQMTRLDGAFLPLNADLRIGRNFQATGITGAVQFSMAKNAEDKKP